MSIQTEFKGMPVYNVNLQSIVVETQMSATIPGRPGPSPYEEWLARGNEGSYEQFLAAIGEYGTGGTISTDADNTLQRGNDGGLYVPPISWKSSNW